MQPILQYIQKVIQDGVSGQPSSRRFILVWTTVVLSIGFLACTFALLFGVVVSETIILGLAGILAGLSGSSYISTKRPEINNRSNQTKASTKEVE